MLVDAVQMVVQRIVGEVADDVPMLRAHLEPFDLAAWESYGGVMVAFGANATSTLQGSHSAKGHMDGILLNANFTLDGRPIVRSGEFVESTGYARGTGRPTRSFGLDFLLLIIVPAAVDLDLATQVEGDAVGVRPGMGKARRSVS